MRKNYYNLQFQTCHKDTHKACDFSAQFFFGRSPTGRAFVTRFLNTETNSVFKRAQTNHSITNAILIF